MLDHQIPESVCPRCKMKVELHASIDEDNSPPKATDVSVCGKCGALCEFDADLRLQLLTVEHFEELPLKTKLMLGVAQRLVRKFNQLHSPN